jgi:hypothetical protein
MQQADRQQWKLWVQSNVAPSPSRPRGVGELWPHRLWFSGRSAAVGLFLGGLAIPSTLCAVASACNEGSRSIDPGKHGLVSDWPH